MKKPVKNTPQVNFNTINNCQPILGRLNNTITLVHKTPDTVKYLIIIFVLFVFHTSPAQEITLKKGTVMDSLAVSDSIPETFAIYLPTSFNPESPMPIIFIFDPKGRGSRVAQLFRSAAEEQGYILVASNNIQENESLLNNVRTGTRLIERISQLFPVGKSRIYTAGLGHGARVAVVIPMVYPTIAGVMAVDDIWLNTEYLEKENNFYFIAIADYLGSYYNLLEDTVIILNKAGKKADFFQFEGSNEWPDGNLLSNALGRFTLNEILTGNRPQNLVFIEKLYNNELETVQKFLQQMKYYKAYEYLESMQGKYSRYGKGTEISQQLRKLGREKLFRNQRRLYQNALGVEEEFRDRYIYFFGEDVKDANFENLGWWNQQIKELKELQESNNPAEAEMAHRLEAMLESMANTTLTNLKEENAAIDPLIFTAILQTIFDEENPKGYFNIISLASQDGDYYTALLYLEDLLKTGYKDLESLYTIPGTLDLKLSLEFNSLVKKYLGESKYYNNI